MVCLRALSAVMMVVVHTPPLFALQTGTPPGQQESTWNLGTLQSGRSYPTTVTARNVSCKGRHRFVIAIEETPWLRLTGRPVLDGISLGEAKSADAIVDLSGVTPGDYRGRIVIRCTTCPPPPQCVQSVSRIEVLMTVTAPPPHSEATRSPDPGEATPPRRESSEAGEKAGPRRSDLPIQDRTKACTVEAASRQQVYSRGNNDAEELTRELESSKDEETPRVEYQTAQLTFHLSTQDRCSCTKEEGRDVCSGRIDLVLAVAVEELTGPFANRPPTWAVFAVTKYSTPTTRTTGGPPQPKVVVTLESDRFSLPALQEETTAQLFGMRERNRVGNAFRRVAGRARGERFFVARAVHELPCQPGTHARRFLLAPKDKAGDEVDMREDFKPQLALDAAVKIEAKDACALRAAIDDMAAWEIIWNYNWAQGMGPGVAEQLKKELPEVQWRVPAFPQALSSQFSLLKLIADDGLPLPKVDSAFPKK